MRSSQRPPLLLLLPLLLLGSAAAADTAPPARQRPSWQAKLTTQSIASVARREGRRDWNEVTQGNRIVLPAEVLDYLTSRGLPYDKFQLLNPAKRDVRLFTGPLDFCAGKGECYLPSWVMRQLGLREGDTCAVATAAFPACAYVKFQPHTSNFLDIGDHYSVLTRTLESFGGLTQGSAVRVTDGQKTYMLDVLEVRGKPTARDDSNGKGVAIGLLECPVEFAEPKDLLAKKREKEAKAKAKAEARAAADGEGEVESEAKAEGESAPPLKTKAAARRRKEASGASASVEGEGSADEAASAKPVPKFKRRKMAEEVAAAGDRKAAASATPDSPFAGKARSLGGMSLGGSSAEEDGDGDGSKAKKPQSEVAKARAAAKAAKEAAAREKAEAEAAAVAAEEAAALAARNPAMVLLETAFAMLRAIIATIISLLRKVLTPGDVNFG